MSDIREYKKTDSKDLFINLELSENYEKSRSYKMIPLNPWDGTAFALKMMEALPGIANLKEGSSNISAIIQGCDPEKIMGLLSMAIKSGVYASEEGSESPTKITDKFTFDKWFVNYRKDIFPVTTFLIQNNLGFL